VSFRVDPEARLAAFAGHGADRIRIDGREHVFADRPLEFVAWAPVTAARRVDGGAVLEIWVQGEANLRIPFTERPRGVRLFAPGRRPGSVGPELPAVRIEDGVLLVPAGPGKAQGHLYVLPA
jgi:hypothetical protein